MPNITTVNLTAGVPSGPAGASTVSTIDALMADGGQATIGITTGAAVITDAPGTLQQYLRGLVKLIAAGISVVVSNANANGRAAAASSAPVVLSNEDQTSLQAVGTAKTTGGATGAKAFSAASTNATSLKGSAGTLYGVTVINTTTTVYYLKLYDKATAPTVGTDVPIQTYPIAASATGAGEVIPFPVGLAFTLGIAWALTAAAADADTGVAATGVTINFQYK